MQWAFMSFILVNQYHEARPKTITETFSNETNVSYDFSAARTAPKRSLRKPKPTGMEYETVFQTAKGNFTWPYRLQAANVLGNVSLGGLMMVHERDETMICGKIMAQGGLQSTEAMLYTLDQINKYDIIPGITLGATIKDDCDRDIYGLEQSVEFIRGKQALGSRQGTYSKLPLSLIYTPSTTGTLLAVISDCVKQF